MFFATVVPALAQDSWKIKHNGKLLLESKEEEVEKNAFSIRIPAFSKTGALLIDYIEKPQQKEWKRTMIIVDENDSEVLRKQGRTVSIQNEVLRSLFKKVKILKVYTMSLPADPAKAALVRVRRVHLATVTITR